jgi:hypothetical protein
MTRGGRIGLLVLGVLLIARIWTLWNPDAAQTTAVSVAAADRQDVRSLLADTAAVRVRLQAVRQAVAIARNDYFAVSETTPPTTALLTRLSADADSFDVRVRAIAPMNGHDSVGTAQVVIEGDGSTSEVVRLLAALESTHPLRRIRRLRLVMSDGLDANSMHFTATIEAMTAPYLRGTTGRDAR